MRIGRAGASLGIIVCVLGSAAPAKAQPGLVAAADFLFYGDNTEFRNPFREGDTLFGAAVRLEGQIELSDSVKVSLGLLGNRRFGSGRSFDLVRPVVALTVARRRSTFVFGTLQTPRAAAVSGPDRTGPHGLVPALQRETLAFERPYEAGLQWLFAGRSLNTDAWLHWQRLNTPEHRERLDAGLRTDWRVRGALRLPLQVHIVHEGGQLFAAGPVRDSVAVASGVIFEGHPLGDASLATLELLGLWSRDTPDRAAPERTVDGGAFFARTAFEQRAWRAHVIAWRGNDFVKDEGDPNYLSRYRSGRRYRGVRDYAEAGLTRSFRVAPSARIEASFRFHRVERHYEYSYRILAVARVRGRVR